MWMVATILLVVLVDDVLVFYTSFEVLLVLMYCYLSLRVYTQRASYAITMLVVYTVLGSSLMASSYVLMYVAQGATTCTCALANPARNM
jgi:NADH:ubiquinone oxidoreductase subunit 4 (subunit M)